MKSIKMLLAGAAIFLAVVACAALNNATATAEPQATDVPPTGTSGLITDVTLAKESDPVSAAPVDPTTVFDSSSVIHATVKIDNAPANTQFTADWYVVDVGGAAPSNSLITSTDLTADGTRYMDFTLSPTSAWPAGKYRVEISVNGQFDQIATYTVK